MKEERVLGELRRLKPQAAEPKPACGAFRLAASDLSGKASTTTMRISGIITMAVGSSNGTATKTSLTKGMNNIASGMNPMNTIASFQS